MTRSYLHLDRLRRRLFPDVCNATILMSAFLVWGICGLAFGANPKPAVPVITLERTVCFGTCPAYKLTIFSDGRVLYEGKEFVNRKGRAQGRIGKKALEKLIAEFNNISYFNLDDEYVPGGKNCPEAWTDSPSAITSLNRGRRKKTIRHYHGCRGAKVLDQLTELENKIDKAVNSNQWIK